MIKKFKFLCKPEIIYGENSISFLPSAIKSLKISRLLLVVDKNFSKTIFFEEIRNNEKYIKFAKMKRRVNPRCLKCKWYKMCYGDCTRFRVFQDSNPANLSYFCYTWENFFEYTHSRFKKLAQRIKERQNMGIQSPLI